MTASDPWVPATERAAHRGYALLGVALVAVAGILAAFVLGGALVAGAWVTGGQPALAVLVIVVFLATAVGFVGTGVTYLRLRGRSVRTFVPVRLPGLRDVAWAAGGYVAALGLVFAAGLLLTALQVQPETTNQAAELGMENPAILLWLVPLSLLVIAPAEEFLFRGVIQGRLREAFDAPAAILLTAGLFALIHFTSLTGAAGARMIAIAILFLPSLVFGVAYERTKNLLVPILIHGTYNSTLILLVYVTIELAGEMPA
jgi:membrane protease YdiL (CAAX protease family)